MLGARFLSQKECAPHCKWEHKIKSSSIRIGNQKKLPLEIKAGYATLYEIFYH